MLTNSNLWRRINYTILAPIYDRSVRFSARARRRSAALLDPQPGERVLLVGAGTGIDLEFLPTGPEYVATDLVPAMVSRLRRRVERLALEQVEVRVMDAMALEFPDASFDAAVLHLILAVVPDAQRCMAEVARVVKPGGRVVIFDKFAPPTGRRSVVLRLLNPLASLLGTNVNRPFEPLIADGPWEIIAERHPHSGGLWRIVLLRRTGSRQV